MAGRFHDLLGGDDGGDDDGDHVVFIAPPPPVVGLFFLLFNTRHLRGDADLRVNIFYTQTHTHYDNTHPVRTVSPFPQTRTRLRDTNAKQRPPIRSVEVPTN